MDNHVEPAITKDHLQNNVCLDCGKSFSKQIDFSFHQIKHTIDETFAGTELDGRVKLVITEEGDEVESLTGSSKSSKVKSSTCSSKSSKIEPSKQVPKDNNIPSSRPKQQCIHCQKRTFPSQIELRAHLREAHPDDHICSICSRLFTRRYLRDYHMTNVHHSLEGAVHCPVQSCPKMFTTQFRLNNHLVQVHGQVARPRGSVIVKSDRKAYRCPVSGCPKMYKTHSRLRTHLEKAHGRVDGGRGDRGGDGGDDLE